MKRTWIWDSLSVLVVLAVLMLAAACESTPFDPIADGTTVEQVQPLFSYGDDGGCVQTSQSSTPTEDGRVERIQGTCPTEAQSNAYTQQYLTAGWICAYGPAGPGSLPSHWSCSRDVD